MPWQSLMRRSGRKTVFAGLQQSGLALRRVHVRFPPVFALLLIPVAVVLHVLAVRVVPVQAMRAGRSVLLHSTRWDARRPTRAPVSDERPDTTHRDRAPAIPSHERPRSDAGAGAAPPGPDLATLARSATRGSMPHAQPLPYFLKASPAGLLPGCSRLCE